VAIFLYGSPVAVKERTTAWILDVVGKDRGVEGASTIKRWSHIAGELDVTGLIDELRQQAATASSGDLKRQEAMLAIQADTLDTIFNGLAR
jgi:hypothetical protein